MTPEIRDANRDIPNAPFLHDVPKKYICYISKPNDFFSIMDESEISCIELSRNIIFLKDESTVNYKIIFSKTYTFEEAMKLADKIEKDQK